MNPQKIIAAVKVLHPTLKPGRDFSPSPKGNTLFAKWPVGITQPTKQEIVDVVGNSKTLEERVSDLEDSLPPGQGN